MTSDANPNSLLVAGESKIQAIGEVSTTYDNETEGRTIRFDTALSLSKVLILAHDPCF